MIRLKVTKYRRRETEEEFMCRLYLENERLMYAAAKRYIDDLYTCQVVVQDSLLKLIPKADRLRELDAQVVAGYLVSTVRNTAFDFLRKEGREQKHQSEWQENELEQIPDPLTLTRRSGADGRGKRGAASGVEETAAAGPAAFRGQVF